MSRSPGLLALGRHAARAFRNAFLSPGFRRFGLAFARDYLRFALESARRWGDTGPGMLRLLGRELRYADRSAMLFLLHEVFVNCAYDFEPAREDPLIVDCGANVGASVLFFRLRFPRARIVAVEPHPAAFRLLESNTAGLHVRLVEAAVTEHGGSAVLHFPRGDAASLVSSIDPGRGGSGAVEVRAVRLSELLESAGGEVDFLKLDVEGAEYGLMRDARRTGALRRVGELGMEFHRLPSEGQELPFLLEVLTESGLQVRSVTAEAAGADGIIRAARPHPAPA